MSEKRIYPPTVKGGHKHIVELSNTIKVFAVTSAEKLKFKGRKEDGVKWIVMYTEDLQKARKNIENLSDSYSEFIGWKGKSSKYATGDAITIGYSEKASVEGKMYWLENFYDKPKLSGKGGCYIVFIDVAKIVDVKIGRKNEIHNSVLSKNQNPFIYDTIINMAIETHLIPDYIDNAFDFAKFEINIVSEDDITVTKEPLIFYQFVEPNKLATNTINEFNFKIDFDWRDTANHEDGTKKYHTIINTTIYKNEKSIEGDSADFKKIDYAAFPSKGKSFLTIAPNGQLTTTVVTEKDIEAGSNRFSWFFGLSAIDIKNSAKKYKETKLDPFSTKELPLGTFSVNYSSMAESLTAIELEKSKMISEISDIQFTKKEFDPCKFSAIEVTVSGEKKPFEIFNEENIEKEFKDNSNIPIGIIAGDAPKEITIKLKGLENKNVRCTGVLLEEGKRHDTKEHVFQMENIILPARNDEGYYQTQRDRKEKTKGKDYDVVSSQKEVTISDQGLKEGVDYSFVGEDTLKLNLPYVYNKTYDSRAKEWLGDEVGEFTNDLLSLAWICRYFVYIKNVKQSYMVPIGTCRYPHQIVKLEVFPDFEWWVSIKFNSQNALYIKETPNYKYRVFTTTKNQNQKKATDYRKKKKKQGDWGHKLDIDVGFKANGSTYTQWSLGDGFSILKTINFVLYAYEVMEDLFFTKEVLKTGKNSNKSIRQLVSEGNAKINEESFKVSNGKLKDSDKIPPPRDQMKKRAAARKGKGLPVSFTMAKPSFAVGVHFKYERSKENPQLMDYFGKIKAEANPLTTLKGSLDLLYFAQFIGPVGAIIGRINNIFDGINFFTCGAVEIDYSLDLVGSVSANIEISGNYHGIDGFDGDANVDLPIKVGIESGGHIKYSLIKMEGGASVTAAAMASFKVIVANDKRSRKYAGELYFEGLKATFTLKFFKKKDKEGGKKKEGLQKEDAGKGNEPKIYEIDIMDPWEDSLHSIT